MSKKRIAAMIINQIIGSMLLTFGVAGIIITGLGSGPFDAFVQYLHIITGFSQGTLTIVIGIILALIIFALSKKKKVLLSILAVIAMGTFINWWLEALGHVFDVNITTSILAEKESIFTKYGIFHALAFGAISYVVLAFGAAYLITTKVIISPVDEAALYLADQFNSYVKGKTLLEVIFLVLAVITGLIIKNVTLQLHIMSIPLVFGIGPLINLFLKLLARKGEKDVVKQVY